MEIKRETQPEIWWKTKVCPGLSTQGIFVTCIGSDCAFWLTKRIDVRVDNTNDKIGVCTKA